MSVMSSPWIPKGSGPVSRLRDLVELHHLNPNTHCCDKGSLIQHEDLDRSPFGKRIRHPRLFIRSIAHKTRQVERGHHPRALKIAEVELSQHSEVRRYTASNNKHKFSVLRKASHASSQRKGRNQLQIKRIGGAVNLKAVVLADQQVISQQQCIVYRAARCASGNVVG